MPIASSHIKTNRPFFPLRPSAAVVRQLTPNWFAATMGTGILAIALAQFPDLPQLRAIGATLWMANILLFGWLSVVFILRWIRHFREAAQLLHNPSMSMFFGCIPMGLATIVNGFLIFGVPLWGEVAVTVATLLWWIDVALSVACGLIVPFAMFTRQSHRTDTMTAIWLLPLVASEVAAVSGALLIPHLADAQEQFAILILSLMLWSFSVPMALGVLVILFFRMALHGLPDRSMAASSWLAIGPIGTGALALVAFADVGPAVLTAHGLTQFAGVFSGVALFGALLLWAYGLWWMAMAIVITFHYARRGIPFNPGWWGYTFPIGVFSVGTLKLGHALDCAPIHVFGSLLVVVLAMAWATVASRTTSGLMRGAFRPIAAPAGEDYAI